MGNQLHYCNRNQKDSRLRHHLLRQAGNRRRHRTGRSPDCGTAEHPQITYVQKLDIEGDKVIVQRQLEDGYTVVEAKMPVLLTAIKELNTPRYMTPKGIFEAYNKTVQVWGFNDVPVDAEKIGLKGSPTNVNRTFSPEAKGKGIMLEGADKETVKTLIAKLDEKHLL